MCVHSAGVPQGGGEGVEGGEGEAGHRGLRGTGTSLHLHSWGQASSQPLTQTAALEIENCRHLTFDIDMRRYKEGFQFN